MSDTATQPADEITAEQKAEWNALHDQMRVLHEARDEAHREAGAVLAWGIQNPDGREWALRSAMVEAQRAVDLWDERTALAEQVEAHPYTPAVRARVVAKRAALNEATA